MPLAARAALLALFGVLGLTGSGCNMVPRQHLAYSQLRTRQLYDQSRILALDRDNQARMAQGLAGENQKLAGDNQKLQQQLVDARANSDTLQQRVSNLMNERSQLQSSFASLKSQSSPLPDSSTRQFEELARKYPQFEFDPQTGVSKFQSDILFESGSSELRPEADPLLREFAKILNSGEAQQLNILVVGHTDDRRVGKPSTRAKHADNWYLSSHRAITVTHALKKAGLTENRMGVAGYGPHQPVVANSDDASRHRNRRVEIFVLAPNASVNGIETAGHRN